MGTSVSPWPQVLRVRELLRRGLGAGPTDLPHPSTSQLNLSRLVTEIAHVTLKKCSCNTEK